MKIITIFFSLLLLSACSSAAPSRHSHPADDAWVKSPSGFGPSARNRLPSERYAQVKESELARALHLLASTQFVALSKEQLYKEFPDTGSGLPPSERYYLVRALSDKGQGAFSVYSKFDELLILHTKMGGCGESSRAAFVVVLDATITKLYGGCSGVM